MESLQYTFSYKTCFVDDDICVYTNTMQIQSYGLSSGRKDKDRNAIHARRRRGGVVTEVGRLGEGGGPVPRAAINPQTHRDDT